jgi:hypothetical protein
MRSISSRDIGGFVDGKSAGQAFSWICLSRMVSPLCEKRNRSPFLSMAQDDNGSLIVLVFLFAFSVSIIGAPLFVKKYTNKRTNGQRISGKQRFGRFCMIEPKGAHTIIILGKADATTIVQKTKGCY